MEQSQSKEAPAADNQPPSTYAPSIYAPSIPPQSPPPQQTSNDQLPGYLNDAPESTYAPSIYPGPSAPPPSQFPEAPLKNSQAKPQITSADPLATYLNDAPESIYAESICSASSFAPPPRSLGTNSRVLNNIPELKCIESTHPAPLFPPYPQAVRTYPTAPIQSSSSHLPSISQRYDQPPSTESMKLNNNMDIPRYPSQEECYKQPPATIRQPAKLYNKDCGVEYKSCGAVAKADAILFNDLLNCEQMSMMQVICSMYHYRMNTIPARNKLSQGAIRGIFGCHIMDYQFSLNELYKHVAMRKRAIGHKSVGNYNFWLLPPHDLKKFRRWLQKIGSWSAGVGKQKYNLWSLGMDNDGKFYLKLQFNQMTLNFIQLINVMHDSLTSWRILTPGASYIKDAIRTRAYFFC